MVYKHLQTTMKKTLLLLVVFSFFLSCNNNEDKNAQTSEQLQGAWYTTSLEVNDQVISTKEHPECLSSFVFKDDKVKLLQMGNHSEQGGIYEISNDTIYIHDIITDQCVMTIKINELSEKNLDILVLETPNVRMKMERMEDE